MKEKDRIIQLVNRKIELTPHLALVKPPNPFPWHQVPHLNWIFKPHSTYAGGAFTTDDIGFRKVSIGGRLLGFREFQKLPGKKNLLIGASTASSVGSSSDSMSIASQLSSMRGDAWFNLAIPAYVSTQELLMYSLLNPEDISEIVVLSGLNTLTAFFVDALKPTDDVIPPSLINCELPVTLRQQLLKSARCVRSYIFRQLRKKIRRRQIREFTDRHLEVTLSVMRKNLHLLRDICLSRNTRLTFIAQPLLSVMPKRLTSEEQEIKDIQTVLGQYQDFLVWGLYTNEILQIYPSYCRSLANICEDLVIPFFDANSEGSLFNGSKWLFADLPHFTDNGCTVCAKQICSLLEN
jgi:hypothetical protein